jgi:hypothetical protein
MIRSARCPVDSALHGLHDPHVKHIGRIGSAPRAPVSDLHERVAKELGWSVRDAQSLSMQSLRDLVRPVDPDLARELDYVIQSGA